MPIFDANVVLEGYPLPGYNQNTDQIVETLRARGIESALIHSARASMADPLSGNRILQAMLENHDSLYGCLVAHLNRVDASTQAIRDLLSSKRFIAVMLTSTDPHAPLQPLVADEVLNTCRRYQKPILLPTPTGASVDVALLLAKKYTMHKFVLVGMGGADWRAGIAAAQQSVNIYLETSGAMDRTRIPAALDAIGAHRLLFGSGMPATDPAAALGLLADSDLSEADMRRVLYENANRLFGLDA